MHRPAALLVLVAVAIAGCRDRGRPSSEVEAITERAWRAHELVIAAGEAAPTCPESGAAMQRAFVAHRQAFVEAIALDRDKARLAAATAYLEANEARYRAIETRMELLADRCADEPTVQAAFDQMSNP